METTVATRFPLSPLSFLVMGNVRRFGRLDCIYAKVPPANRSKPGRRMRWRIEDDSILDRSIDSNRILRDADTRLLRRDESHDLPSQAAVAAHNTMRFGGITSGLEDNPIELKALTVAAAL
ncbi:hypothetical protein DAPPUDRAFT_242222 [Daphnia pulex]|uniref:Uncharacterized protein n=1 Tax=Daphnia pulex TaxID=6669 RepID=E9GG51_DAPPU|nr:hypothetical protein DAPPUDRAFT_242222 [Daphnia pulex]|eukprot:EFX81338.1 hypothetical protein DAPPUDRAFT_242222 [Daphnia pulex]